MQLKDRRGFTLVELLVVIAIIGVLVALLLPAVNSAREAARRTQCMNQTRQIGLSILNHEAALRLFPGGGTVPWPELEDYSANGKPFGPEKQGFSWAFQILPYLEEGAITGLATTDLIAQSPVPMYFCPSRRQPTFLTPQVLQHRHGAWLMDYASLQPIPVPPEIDVRVFDRLIDDNFGCRQGYGYWGRGTSAPGGMDFNPRSRSELGRQYVGFKGVIVRSSYLVQSDGTVKNLGYDSITKPRRIKDGMSKTAMVAEKWVGIRDYATSFRAYDDRGWSDGWDIDTVSHAICPPAPDSIGPPEVGGYSENSSAGSAHPGGINVVYGDGAVHFLNFDIDPLTFNLISHRSDGQVVNEE